MNRAIIVGASSGIGREMAKILLAQGWKIGIAARRVEMLHEVEAINPNMVKIREIDVNSVDSSVELLSLINDLGGMNLYIHVAGIGKQNPELAIDVEINTVKTNALGFTAMINTAFNYMASNDGGHIAAISSIAGTKGLGPAPAYSATKAFQNNYLQALEQLANSRRLNIRFTDIRPGFVRTALLNDGKNYPMLMNVERVAHSAVNAILHKKHVYIIDWRYRILVRFWQLIPNFIWRKISILGK